MYLKIAICDDDAEQILSLQKYLEKYELEFDVDFKISLFTSGEKLLSQYKGTGSFHIIFLDVEMFEKSGLETARIIRSKGDFDTKIVFVSNYPQYMQDSFNVQAFHYLQKPLAYSTFCDLMTQIVTLYQKSQTVKFLIRQDGSEELINLNDILYIESVKNSKNLLHYVLTDHELYTKGVLLNLKEELQDYHFVTPYRGFLVNLKYIHYINETSLTLTDGTKIPLSRRCNRQIHNLFTKHVLTFR